MAKTGCTAVRRSKKKMACDVYCIFDTVLFAIWCISLPVYIILLYTLIKYRRSVFDSSFFKIFISLGIADICSMIGIYAFVKALYVKIFNKIFLLNPVLIASSTLVFTWGCMFVQLNGVLLLTVNRYVSLIHWSDYDEIFNRKKTRIYIAIQWIMAVVFVLPKTTIRSSYAFQPDNQTLRFVVNSTYMRYFQFATVYIFALALVVVVMYAQMIAHIYRARKQVAPVAASTAAENSREMRLVICGGILAVVLLFYGMFCALMLFVNIHINAPLKLMYAIVADAFSELNPYVLILMCKSVRVHFIKVLTCNTGE